MKDQYSREISYLRLSVTERCTLRCVYCRSDEGLCPKAEELSALQLVEITKACAELGITKVRITGGEPLLRRDLTEIIAGIKAIDSIVDISLTTNAQDLKAQAQQLKDAGLNRLNISMDSLKPARFQALTGGNLLKVLEGIDAALKVGLTPVKVNCVLMKDVNDDEIDDFIILTRDKPIEVRFIEYMPIGESGAGKVRINNQDILAKRPELKPVQPRYAGQPSKDYRIEGYMGRVGLISPISHRFCEDCNRIRVMSDGTLRACLGEENEVSLKPVMDKGHEAIRALIESTIFNKPRGHKFGCVPLTERNMSRIGG
jgi:cyclic pyranopterin phosphate synthase